MSGSGRSVVASGGGAGGGSSSGTIYSPGNPMVTTMSGPGVNPQTTIRTQAPPAIAVRITTAPVSTATSSSQVLGRCAYMMHSGWVCACVLALESCAFDSYDFAFDKKEGRHKPRVKPDPLPFLPGDLPGWHKHWCHFHDIPFWIVTRCHPDTPVTLAQDTAGPGSSQDPNW